MNNSVSVKYGYLTGMLVVEVMPNTEKWMFNDHRKVSLVLMVNFRTQEAIHLVFVKCLVIINRLKKRAW